MSTRDLVWIGHDRLVEVATKRFSKAIKQLEARKELHTDPTSMIARSVFQGVDLAEVQAQDRLMASARTLQNAVGLFHQDVLGSVVGWRNHGTSGGIFDISSQDTVASVGNRRVVAEVKMRYNTIKASDEKQTWDNLANAVKMYGGAKECVAYIFQIIPKTDEAYDRPWEVSGRQPNPCVRAADGVTAYHLVTGDKNAFHDLMHVLPEVFWQTYQDVMRKGASDPANSVAHTLLADADFVRAALSGTVPAESALGLAD